MRLKNFREAYQDGAKHKTKKEEVKGKDFNWIVANHLSLKKWLKNNNISDEMASKMNVICDTYITANEDKEHLRKTVKQNLREADVIEDNFYYKGVHKRISIVDGDRPTLPLLYIYHTAFSLNHELIFETRLAEVKNEGTSDQSVKNVLNKRSVIDLDLKDKIEASLFAKSNFFVEPLLNIDGSNVEWYIPYSTEESINRANALRLYNQFHGFGNTPKDIPQEIYQVAGNKSSKEALRKELLKARKETVKAEVEALHGQ